MTTIGIREFSSPIYDPDLGPQCLSFWQRVDGYSANMSIKVLIEADDSGVKHRSTAWSLFDTQLCPYWMPYNVNIKSKTKYQVGMFLISGSNALSLAGISCQ